MSLQRKWPEEKLPVGLESIRNFNIRAKVVGPSVCIFFFTQSHVNLLRYPQGSFVKYIQAETSTRVQIKGIGSGFIDQEVRKILLSSQIFNFLLQQTGAEEPVPLYIHITSVLLHFSSESIF